MKKLMLIAVIAGLATEARAGQASLLVTGAYSNGATVYVDAIADILVRDNAVVLRGASREGTDFSLELFYSPDPQRFARGAGFALELALWRARNSGGRAAIYLNERSLQCGFDDDGRAVACRTDLFARPAKFVFECYAPDGGYPGITVAGTGPGFPFTPAIVHSLGMYVSAWSDGSGPAIEADFEVGFRASFQGTDHHYLTYNGDRDFLAMFQHVAEVLDTMPERGETLSIVTTSAVLVPNMSDLLESWDLRFLLGP